MTSTAIEKRFVLCRLATTQARQTVKAAEAAKLVADVKKANINANIEIMPEDMRKHVRAMFNAARSDLDKTGFAVKIGNDIEYLVKIGPDLQTSVDKANECDGGVRQYLTDTIGTDVGEWEAFRALCLSNIGELDIDTDRAFPYHSLGEYLREFSCKLDISPVPDPDMIPSGLTGDLAAQVSNAYAGFSVSVVNALRDNLADTIDARVESFGDLNKVTLRSFNDIMSAAHAVVEVVNGSNPEMVHIASRVQEWLRGVDFNTISPAHNDYNPETANNLVGALNMASGKLRELLATQVDPTPADNTGE